MSPVAAAPRRAASAAPAQIRVALLDLKSYGGGFTLPEGDYALELMVGMEKAHEKMGNRQPRLGLFVYAHSFGDPTADPFEQFLSFGSKAHLNFVPTEDGKGITPIPGAGGTLPNSSNAALFIKSLYDSGLPEGIGADDLAVLDGIWVHTQQVPEPEERKGFATGTGEVEQEKRAPGKIPVVTEIKDDGKPWEGGGGFAFKTATAPAARKGPVAAPARAAVTAPPARRAAPVAAASEPAADTEDVETAAVNAVSAVLEAMPQGTTKLKLRTESFKALTKAGDEATTQAVMSTYFADDAALNAVLNTLGYQLVGSNVSPQS